MTAEDKKNSWVTGESLLRPDSYDFLGLLDACNKGQLRIFDVGRRKVIVPISQLTRRKRRFDTPTAFIIPISKYDNKCSITSCNFKEPTNPIWKSLFMQQDGCWQSWDGSTSPKAWEFNIPDQLSSYDELAKLQLYEGEKYILLFEVTLAVSGPDALCYLEDTPLQGEEPFIYREKQIANQMEVWFKYLNENNDVAWYANLDGEKYRSVDLHTCPKEQNSAKKNVDYLSDYAPDRSSPLPIKFKNLKDLCPLEECVKEVARNCGISLTVESDFDPYFTKNRAKLRNLIMDTDYEYDHPNGLPSDKYEPFIFDEELYIHRYYYFNHNKGHNEFVKKVISFLYQSAEREVRTTIPNMPHSTMCQSQCEKQGTITYNQEIHINQTVSNISQQYCFINLNNGSEEFATTENSASPDPATSEASSPSSSEAFHPTIYPAQLEIPKKYSDAGSKEIIMEDIRERIRQLRRCYLDKLIGSSGKITENEVYFELRQKGVSRTTAARIMYLKPNAREAVIQMKGYESEHILIAKTEREKKNEKLDSILNVTRDKMQWYVKKLEGNLLESFPKKSDEDYRAMLIRSELRTNYIDILARGAE